MSVPRPRVVVSQCLGFAAVRYNGAVLRDDLVARLATFVDFVEVCPEVAIRLGVPRPPIRIVQHAGALRLLQPATGRDVTDAMQTFAADFLGRLDDVDGFILKNRSPSCGLRDARVHGAGESGPVGKGAGMFGAAVLAGFPAAAVEDEGRLRDHAIREYYLTKLFALARLRAVRANGSLAALIGFHTTYKYVLMTYAQSAMRELGQLVAAADPRRAVDAIEEYRYGFGRALHRPARLAAHVNSLMHALGYFRDRLTPGEKAHFLATLAQFRAGAVSLSAPVAILRSWIVRFGEAYLARQAYFEPYPRELVSLADSGGRVHRHA